MSGNLLCLLGTLLYFISLPELNAQQLLAEEVLAFSTVQGEESSLRDFAIHNQGDQPLRIEKLVLQGKNATQFNLRTPVTFPLLIEPDQQTTLAFSFKPIAGKGPGIVKAELILISNDATQPEKKILLQGLVAQGLEGEMEPSLHLVLQTLGYTTAVGGQQLQLDTADALLGEEIQAFWFKRANARLPVSMLPVARYSPSERVPFGFYFRNKKDQLRYKKVGTLTDAYREHQTLYPKLYSGETAFNPGDQVFGLFTSTATHITYTEPNLNTGVMHAVRVFPVKNLQGETQPQSYLVCFEEATNGDYQDFIFLLKNVEIVE